MVLYKELLQVALLPLRFCFLCHYFLVELSVLESAQQAVSKSGVLRSTIRKPGVGDSIG